MCIIRKCMVSSGHFFSNQLVSFTLPISLFHLMQFFRFTEIVMSVIKKGHFEIFFLAFSGCAVT